MINRLYRFRILHEEPSHLLAAIDEADGSQVWLAPIQFDPARRPIQVKELLAVADSRRAEKFTANGYFYFVADSESAARDLLGTALASMKVTKEKPKENTGDADNKKEEEPPELESPIPNHTMLKMLGGLFIAALIVIIVITAWPSKTATPELEQVDTVSGHTIRISAATPGATIYYTTDGSTPTTYSMRYDDSHPLSGLAGGTTIHAIAKASGHPASNVGERTVYISEAEGSFDRGKYLYDQKKYMQAHEPMGAACREGFSLACNYLGVMYAKGQGVWANNTTARSYFQKACDAGIAQGCANLGAIYEIEGMTTEARDSYKKACDSGNEKACDALKRLP